VATVLHAPLDVLVVRKIGLPGEEELALGAIASGGVRVLNHDLIQHLHVSDELIESITQRERVELERRERLYRENRPPAPVERHTVVVVDDGLPTGATMLAAYRTVQARGAKEIIVAVPVAAKQVYEAFRKQVDQIICAAAPEPFGSVGEWYENFCPTSDEEVRRLLKESALDGTKSRVHASNIRGAQNESRKSIN
jgi:putative phosphoribosyl transferase